MHIVYGVNEAFMPILAVSLSSLLLHAEGEALHFHILSLGIEEESKEKLRQYVETEGQKISFYDLEEKLSEWKEKLPALFTGKFSKATLLRLFIPSTLPETITKALYLDADTVVLQSILPLYHLKLGDKLLGMAPEPSIYKKHKEFLSLAEESPYYNAGVMLMNLSLLREEGMEEKCLRYYQMKEGQLPFNDQDILNMVCKGRIRSLPQRFNFFSNYAYARYSALCRFSPWYQELESKKSYSQAKAHPVIVHFAGDERPWREGNHNYYRRAFDYYAEESPLSLEKEKGKQGYLFCYHVLNLLTFVFPKLREKVGELYYRSMGKEN